MTTAPPAVFDPSLIHLSMPIPASPSPPALTPPSQSRLLDILKIIVGLFIILILGAILIVLLFFSRPSNGIDLRESNEKIAELQRLSNENIARLQREQQLYIENQRLIHQENLTEKHRLEDQLIAQLNREQDLFLAKEQLRQQLEIEEKRLKILLEQKLLTEQHQQEELKRINADLLSNFFEEVLSAKQPLNITNLQLKVHLLIRRFDPFHKSLLINFLYKNNYLNSQDSDKTIFDLQGANLKQLDLSDTNIGTDQGLRINYNHLSLPLTNLINASFEQIYLHKANFSLCNMLGASFLSSETFQTDFSRTELTFSNFHSANVTQSNFSQAKIERASFENSILSHAYMHNANLRSTNFQGSYAIKTKFSTSDISYGNFQNADLTQAQMDYASIGSAIFYQAKCIQTNFSHAYMPQCIFQWADLTSASFRYAFLDDANFDNANVQNVDFTGATLKNAKITPGQLDVVLSIAHATLPDGSIGKNKNLVKNGNAQCIEMNSTILEWINNGNVIINKDQLSDECNFQAKTINATLQQTIDIRRYERLIEHEKGQIYIEMQDKTDGILDSSNPSVYMNVRFFDSNNNQIHEESSLSKNRFIPPSTFVATLPCPSTTAELQLTIVFRKVNATVDNIYVTIE